MSELPVDVAERIARQFQEEGPRIVEMLRAFKSRRPDIANGRILHCVVQAASGNDGSVEKYIKLAETDWRDLILVAEYGPGEVRLRDFSKPFEK